MNRPVPSPTTADAGHAARRSADADVLGPVQSMPPPRTGTPHPTSGDSAQASDAQGMPGHAQGVTAPQQAGPLPPPAEDENQPGFIGERNRPHPP
jgi:hypothetical protein